MRQALTQKISREIASTTGSWGDIGPSSENYGGTSLNSGRVLSLAYDSPLSTLFVGTADGGIWKSQSPFTSWTPLTDSMPDAAIGALAVDPTDSSGGTIYAGTGESTGSGDSKYGAGVYVTTDGGSTWKQEGATAFGTGTISRIVIDPVTGDAYASVESPYGGGGVFMSTNATGTTPTWTNASNLKADSVSDLQIDSLGDVYAAVGRNLSSQTDNGVWECPAGCAALPSPVFTNIDGTTLPGAAGDQYKLALSDPTVAPGVQTMYAIVSSAANPTQVLGLYRADNAGPGPATWVGIGLAGSFDSYEGQAWYNMALYAPDQSNVYVSLENVYRVISAGGASPSYIDLTCVYGAGVGSGISGSCQGSGVHTDQHAITSGPSGSLLFGNDGGVWQMASNGTQWADLNGNLSTNQFYGGSLGTASTANGGPCTANCDPTITLGGLQDNGTVETNSTIGSQWSRVFGGDGMYTAIDPTNNDNQFEEYTYGQINGTGDNWGTTFGATPGACHAGQSDTNFSAPMMEDPASPGTLLSGDRNLCESTNATSGAPTWSDISGTLNIPISATPGGATESGSTVTLTFPAQTTAPPVGWFVTVAGVGIPGYDGEYQITASTTTTLQYSDSSSGLAGSGGGTAGVSLTRSAISAIAVSDAGGATIYTSDNSGNTYFTADNGASWHPMDDTSCVDAGSGPNCAAQVALGPRTNTLSPADCFCITVSGLAADPTTRGVVYAVVNGYQGGSAGHVFRGNVDFTTNTVTWTDISNNLPDVPLYTVAVNPAKPDIVYVGGGPGVYVTADAQDASPAWAQEGANLPNSDVFNLQVSSDGERLVAFTHGRSAWQYSGDPTAAAYSRLQTHSAHGRTVITWHSTLRTAGFNVYSGNHRLNRALVTSRTHQYRFMAVGTFRRVRLVAVPPRSTIS